jgi:hypothetical protein
MACAGCNAAGWQSVCVGRSRSKLGRSVTRALITGITGQDGSYLAEFLPPPATLP